MKSVLFASSILIRVPNNCTPSHDYYFHYFLKILQLKTPYNFIPILFKMFKNHEDDLSQKVARTKHVITG